MNAPLRLAACLLVALPATLGTRTGDAQTIKQTTISEKIEWTWAVRPDTAQPNLPNILLEGDSISRGYYPEVVKLLAGRANCYLFATSASSGDPRLALQIRDALQLFDVKFAVIHFNNGMHGWDYTEAQYAQGLPPMLHALQQGAPGAKLIWTTTTPVRKDTAGGASNDRVDHRNALSARLMEHQGLGIDDQHALMLQHQELHSDDVHFTDPGYALEAKQAAESILALLPPAKP